MGGTFASRLRDKLAAGHAPVCIGLDPRVEALPADLLPQASPAARIAAFCREVIDAVAPAVPAVKPNIAFFERYGAAGFAAYQDTCAAARAAGLLVIGDIKRGDIGSTAEAYAALHLDLADAVTLHPLLGKDSVEPFLRRCAASGGALFVLVRTSNPGAVALQGLRLANGDEVSDAIAREVDTWNRPLEPADPYGPIGAVIGATYPHDLARLRRLMPRSLVLIPGVGAQGGAVSDTLAAFDAQGMGGIVNQSRGVVQSFAPNDRDWQARIARAAREFADSMLDALRARALGAGR